MAINKVVFGSSTLIDISDTTATAGRIEVGYSAYGANGVKVNGTLVPEVNNLEVGGATVEGTAAIFDEGAVLTTKTINTNGTYDAEDDSVDGYSSVTVNVPTGGGDIGGLAYMVDVSSYDYAFAYMLMCMKKGDTKGGTVTYTSAFSNTETKILETGLTTIHGIVFSRHDVSISTNVDSQTCKTIFIFLNSSGSLNAIGMYANAVARIYEQAQGTVQQATPLNGSIRFDGGDIYYAGRYNKKANYQMLKVNTEYEWLAW